MHLVYKLGENALPAISLAVKQTHYTRYML